MGRMQCFLIVMITIQLFSQTIDTWERRYGTELRETGKQIIKMNDGNYLISCSASPIAFKEVIWLIAVNENGDSLWTKTIDGGDYNLYINDLAYNYENGLYAVDYKISSTDSGSEGYLSKRSTDYSEIWKQVYTDCSPLSLTCTPDSGCAVIVSDFIDIDVAISWIEKYDKNGNHQFSSGGIFTKSEKAVETISDITLTSEGDYLTLWKRRSESGESQFLIYFDDSLNVSAIKPFYGYDLSKIEKANNDDFVISGSGVVLKIDQYGDIIWELEIPDYLENIVKSADGNYFVSNSTNTYKVDDTGKLVWSKNFGSNSMVPTDDGGCLAVGTKFDDVWICKFDQDGNYTNINDYVYPNAVELQQNYPNPFNPVTEISYSLKNEGMVTLSVFNTKGELVNTLVNEKKTAGNHSVRFNGDGLNSGIYFYRLGVDSKAVQSRKMIMLK